MADEAFELKSTREIPLLGITAETYEHRVTGATHYHLAADNSENAFMVAFRTVPEDSTGVAHILEHTALCGSERFPVRDPWALNWAICINLTLQSLISMFLKTWPSAWTLPGATVILAGIISSLLEIYGIRLTTRR